MTRKFVYLLLGASILTLVIAACGTAATPEWAADAQATRVAIAATSDHQTAIAPTLTPTTPPTDTPSPIPPTATTVPTETAIPPTVPPTATAEVTVEATAAATAEASAGGGDAAAIAAALKAGDAEAGKTLFNALQPSTGFACATCHSVDEGKTRIIGPGLFDVSVDGPFKDAGQGVVEYLHTSIVDPQAYVVKGDPPYPENLMPQVFGTLFSDQQIKDLIAYLLTLHN